MTFRRTEQGRNMTEHRIDAFLMRSCFLRNLLSLYYTEGFFWNAQRIKKPAETKKVSPSVRWSK